MNKIVIEATLDKQWEAFLEHYTLFNLLFTDFATRTREENFDQIDHLELNKKYRITIELVD